MTKKRYGNELHPVYRRWLAMTQRCTTPSDSSYNNYGARGIKVAPDLQDFCAYRDYVMSLPNCDPEHASLDRIDNDKDYERGNLRWTSRSVQSVNQRHANKGKNRFTGVNWSKAHNKWVARINFNGKSVFSRTFLTEQAALDARNSFIQQEGLPHAIQAWSDI